MFGGSEETVWNENQNRKPPSFASEWTVPEYGTEMVTNILWLSFVY
jgi:hypothetical protein